jgi:hypothetical protein
MTAVTDALAKLEPPIGFSLNLDSPDRGYIFQMELAPIKPEDFIDPHVLEKHFKSAFAPMLEWYTKNRTAILRLRK